MTGACVLIALLASASAFPADVKIDQESLQKFLGNDGQEGKIQHLMDLLDNDPNAFDTMLENADPQMLQLLFGSLDSEEAVDADQASSTEAQVEDRIFQTNCATTCASSLCNASCTNYYIFWWTTAACSNWSSSCTVPRST